MAIKQKRKFSRIDFNRKVNLDFITDWYNECLIIDLCLTGMFIQGSFRQQEGEYCLITLVHEKKSSDMTIQAICKITRKTDQGIALQFISMTFESYMYLQMLLLYECNEPMDIGLELPERCPFSLTDEAMKIPDLFRFLYN